MKRTLLQLACLTGALVAVSAAIVVVNQSAQLVTLAGRAHPLAGSAVLWGLLLFYAVCLLAPLVLWMRLPRSLVPPAADSGPEFEDHLVEVARRLRANPRLRADAAPEGELPATREAVEAATRRLDAAADELTRKAAGRVFLATALSQNGSLDSLFVLGLQTRLVWEIAHVYRQRPSLRDLGWLYANVLTTAFVVGEIEDLDLSQQIQPVVQGALGAAAGAVPGLQVAGSLVTASIVTGGANAFLTLRVGVVARRYCGALTRPEKRGLRRSAFLEAAGMLGAIAAANSKKVVAALARASGRTVAGAVTGIGSKVRDGAGSVGSAVRSGAGSVGNAVKTGAGSVGSTVRSGAGGVLDAFNPKRKTRR